MVLYTPVYGDENKDIVENKDIGVLLLWEFILSSILLFFSFQLYISVTTLVFSVYIVLLFSSLSWLFSSYKDKHPKIKSKSIYVPQRYESLAVLVFTR